MPVVKWNRLSADFLPEDLGISLHPGERVISVNTEKKHALLKTPEGEYRFAKLDDSAVKAVNRFVRRGG